MEILDILSWEIPYTRCLLDKDYEHFARQKQWQLKEAIMLSLGYHPNRQGTQLDKAEAQRIGLLVRDRWDLVDKAMRSGELAYSERRFKLGSEAIEYVIESRTFLAWLSANQLSLPDGLAKAVQKYDPHA